MCDNLNNTQLMELMKAAHVEVYEVTLADVILTVGQCLKTGKPMMLAAPGWYWQCGDRAGGGYRLWREAAEAAYKAEDLTQMQLSLFP